MVAEHTQLQGAWTGDEGVGIIATLMSLGCFEAHLGWSVEHSIPPPFVGEPSLMGDGVDVHVVVELLGCPVQTVRAMEGLAQGCSW